MQAQSVQWSQLQRSLQEQYILTQSQAQQKNTFQKKLTNSLISFHTSFIQYIQQSDSSSKQGKKKILKDDGFGNAYTFVKEVVLTLSRDFKIMTQIIKRKDQQWNQKWIPISKLIVNNLFEDIVEEQINHKDIMYLITEVIDIIIGQSSNPDQIKFATENVSSHILKDFTQRSAIKKYSQMILKPTLLMIYKEQSILDLDTPTQKITNAKMNKLSKEQKSSNANQENPYKQFTKQYNQNWTKKYSNVLKQYDKAKGYAKTKEPLSWYVSKHLLYFLGVSDEASVPTFDLAKVQQKLQPFTSQIYLNRKDSSHKLDELSDHLSIIKNIICCFFGEVFKHIYNMPMSIRLICKLIEQFLLRNNKDLSRSQILSCVSNFLFKTWLLPQLKFHDKILAIGLINQVKQKNLEFIQEMIVRILNGVEVTKDRSFKNQINNISKTLKKSVDNYLEQVLKCDVSHVQNLITRTKHQRIRSYSICLNYEEMKILFEMILDIKQEISAINPTIVNRTNRIKDMTDNFELFKGKTDKDDGEYYDGTMAYVLFSQLALPKHLQSDYYKNYIEAYKNNKPKNLMRKIFISLDPSNINLMKIQPINKFFKNLEKSSKYKQDFVGYDKLPMNIKVSYLLSLKIEDYEQLGKDMEQQLKQRKPVFEALYNQTKKQFLRATDSVRRYNQKVSEEQIKLHITNRLQKLEDFAKKVNINRCISSPKTRQYDTSYKNLIARNPNLPNKDQIWFESQSSCFHVASNLQFIKALTGDIKGDDKECHCNKIYKILDVFALLPEVRSCAVTGEDKIGIRSTFFQFIDQVIKLIKANPKQNAVLLEDENWLSEHLQRMMTRRIYERIYPKHMTYNETALYFRLKTIEWIMPEHLSIVYNVQTDSLWKIAALTLNEIDNFKTPAEKMQCVVNCWEMMNNILRLTADSNSPANADTVAPLIQYIILKASPRRLYSNMNFISIFSQPNKMMSGAGYAFTQLQLGINFLEILNQSRLTGVSKLLYEKNIYDKQIEYGMYFLQKRPRAERHPFDQNKFKDMFRSYLPS